jgi:hypothetical protein
MGKIMAEMPQNRDASCISQVQALVSVHFALRWRYRPFRIRCGLMPLP